VAPKQDRCPATLPIRSSTFEQRGKENTSNTETPKLQQADEENALTGKIESAEIVASQKVSQSTRGSFVYDSDDTDMEEAPPLQEGSTEGSRTSKSSSSFEDHMMLLQSKQHLLLKSR
jgi:hypothetical protein